MNKKRGQRQGSVTQRPNGKYMAQLPPNEVGRRPTKYFETKTEANKWLNEQLYLLNKGLINVNTNMLTWAITRAGYDVPTFAVKFPKILEWLEGQKKPTVKQLEEFLCEVFKAIR